MPEDEFRQKLYMLTVLGFVGILTIYSVQTWDARRRAMRTEREILSRLPGSNDGFY